MNHQPVPQPTAHTSATGERAVFAKVMSDPVPIPEAGIDRAVEILRGGRPFRYGEDTGGQGEASLLERDIAQYAGRAYAVAVNSCGCSLFLALKSLGVAPGDQVLCNAFTLAPVPGAIAHAAARPVMVDITARLTIDLDDLRAKIASSGAKVLLLSQMRGHMPDMPALMEICDAAGVDVIEDCAHTLGARFAGRLAGTFGRIGCYSAQTFKHMNAGEGGLIVTDDAEVAARAILMSGSYMMYHQNGARPELEVFEPLRDEMPNFSMRMTDTAAALLRPQLAELEGWTARWNASYRRLADGLGRISGLFADHAGQAGGFRRVLDPVHRGRPFGGRRRGFRRGRRSARRLPEMVRRSPHRRLHQPLRSVGLRRAGRTAPERCRGPVPPHRHARGPELRAGGLRYDPPGPGRSDEGDRALVGCVCLRQPRNAA